MMNSKNEFPEQLDALITEALRTNPDTTLSASFTDKVVRKAERRFMWQEIIREFAMKAGLVAGSLIILILCLLFPARETTNPFLKMLLDNWQIVTGAGALILITGFSDQVLLKYFTKQRTSRDLNCEYQAHS
jgi:hypothetical protein